MTLAQPTRQVAAPEVANDCLMFVVQLWPAGNAKLAPWGRRPLPPPQICGPRRPPPQLGSSGATKLFGSRQSLGRFRKTQNEPLISKAIHHQSNSFAVVAQTTTGAARQVGVSGGCESTNQSVVVVAAAAAAAVVVVVVASSQWEGSRRRRGRGAKVADDFCPAPSRLAASEPDFGAEGPPNRPSGWARRRTVAHVNNWPLYYYSPALWTPLWPRHAEATSGGPK